MSWRQPGWGFREAVATAVPTPSAAEAMASLRDVGPAAAALTFSELSPLNAREICQWPAAPRRHHDLFEEALLVSQLFFEGRLLEHEDRDPRPSFFRVAW